MKTRGCATDCNEYIDNGIGLCLYHKGCMRNIIHNTSDQTIKSETQKIKELKQEIAMKDKQIEQLQLKLADARSKILIKIEG